MLPTIGIGIFVASYVYSSTLYPGGSQADPNTVGFDWLNNYWCNLTNERAMNGQLNPARPFAVFAMMILCGSLLLFFFQFSQKMVTDRFWKIAIQTSGVFAMIFSSLIFTSHHDLMTILASIFGIVTVIGIIREIYKSQLVLFKWSGIFCMFLLGLNNYIYYSNRMIEYLPLLQKITFVCVLLWITAINYRMSRNDLLQD